MRTSLIDKGWYLLWWVVMFTAARLFLVNPIIRAFEKTGCGPK